MLLNQISVFLENKRGRLAEITNILEAHRIDIRALSIADTKDFGILRLIVDRPDDAAAALKDEGFTVSITKVIAPASTTARRPCKGHATGRREQRRGIYVCVYQPGREKGLCDHPRGGQ
ncbi:MAG: ACT domain-containing protein [Oscillospiraceae bacterium]